MLTYALVEFEAGPVQLLQEAWFGQLLRYCDLDGNTVEPPAGGARVITSEVARPPWAVDPGDVINPPALSWAAGVPAEYHWIDVGPFFDRFGAKALTITSSTNATVQGLVTLILPRKYIDLKRSDLPTMVGILQAVGLINSADVAVALNPKTTEAERHVKGLSQPGD